MEVWFGDTSNLLAALLIGRSMPGMRALDIVRAVDILAARPDVDPARIKCICIGRASVGMLYAAAFDSRLSSLELDGLLTSYQAIIESRYHRNAFEHVVQGAIRRYDIDDLLKAISHRPVGVKNRVGPMGELGASQ
jgi:hypothetical protein